MGKGGQGETNGVEVKRQLPEYTWDDIQDKTTNDNKWLVIEGQVYNITSWSKRHPGGPKVIGHYAGQDATVSIVVCVVLQVIVPILLLNLCDAHGIVAKNPLNLLNSFH